MRKFFIYIKQIYRLPSKFEKQENLVWKDLKKIFNNNDFCRSVIHEKEKTIEAVYPLINICDGDGIYFNLDKVVINDRILLATYSYIICDGYFQSSVKILDNFPFELEAKLSVLAAHFNNILNKGIVIVNFKNQYVEYYEKRDIYIPLIYWGELDLQVTRHKKNSKNIQLVFQRLLNENDDPATIITDYLNNNEQSL